MRTPARRAAATLAAFALALTACSTPQSPPASGPSSGWQTSTAPSSASPSASPTPAPEPEAVLDQQAVAAAHPAAVDAGMQVLNRGGNAADAAVAVAFAVSVVEPYASGMGGGGAAILAAPGEDPVSYDYREVVAQDGRIPASGTGVPGFVAGLGKIHAEHGELDWDQLLEPAKALAAEGFPVTGFLAQRMRSDSGPAALAGLEQFAGPDGQPLREGMTLVQEDLADSLTAVAEDGPESFYTGSMAERLSAVDGLDAGSLAAYEPEQVEPVSGGIGEYEVFSAAPPLPGAAVVQQLQVAESLGIADHQPGSAGYVERLAEAWAVADQSVTDHLGDPDFVDVPVDQLTDAGRNAGIAEDLTVLTGRTGEGEVGTRQAADVVTAVERPVPAGNTTHLTVVDADGLTVSMTNTITDFWGGPRAGSVGGFFLNNQLTRFGAIATPSNQPESGRKSVSWSAPSLVVDGQGRPVLGIGTPGGHRIPNILGSVLVPWALQDASLEEAVAAPRYHLLNGVLSVEEEPSAELGRLITTRGWQLQPTRRDQAVFGSVQALEVDYGTGTITGARDSRRDADFAVEDVPEAKDAGATASGSESTEGTGAGARSPSETGEE
jgi:gamma-glutamyltranspeptidase/glutathione hydrolase